MRINLVCLSVLIVFILAFSIPLHSATFNGKSIDKTKFQAQIRLSGEAGEYLVSVVFIKKKANIVFAPNQQLPPRFSISPYLTLYLDDVDVHNPDNITLDERVPPQSDPDKKDP